MLRPAESVSESVGQASHDTLVMTVTLSAIPRNLSGCIPQSGGFSFVQWNPSMLLGALRAQNCWLAEIVG